MTSLPVAASVRAVWGRSIISPLALVLMWSGNLALGLVLAVGDPRRADGPTFAGLDLIGGPRVAGAVFIGVAAALVAASFASRPLLAAAFALATAAHLLFAAGFVHAVLHEPPPPSPTAPLVPLTGIVSYGWLVGGMHLLNAVLYLRDRSPTPGARGPVESEGQR